MTNNFPIYGTLFKDSEDRDLSIAQKNAFIKKLQIIDQSGMDLIYAIIMLYYIEHEDVTTHIVPYGGKFEGDSLQFNLDNLPNKLRQMLNKFVIIHIKSMNENLETIRNNLKDMTVSSKSNETP